MSQTGRWITGAIVGAVIAVVAVGVCGKVVGAQEARDGYGRHDRQDVYIAADAASPAYTCGQPSGATTEGTARATTVATTRKAPAAASYPNRSAARAAGAAPLYAGQPGYSSELDRDGDGVACE